MNRPKPPYSLVQSFAFAIGGIAFALKNERNLRIHFSVMAYVLYFSISYYSFTNVEYALLVAVIGLVITMEMINTAIEKTVDIETPVYHGLAKIAKDVAAGAVLVSTLVSVAVSYLLLWDTAVFAAIAADVAADLPLWAVIIVLNILWVMWPCFNVKKEKGLPH